MRELNFHQQKNHLNIPKPFQDFLINHILYHQTHILFYSHLHLIYYLIIQQTLFYLHIYTYFRLVGQVRLFFCYFSLVLLVYHIVLLNHHILFFSLRFLELFFLHILDDHFLNSILINLLMILFL